MTVHKNPPMAPPRKATPRRVPANRLFSLRGNFFFGGLMFAWVLLPAAVAFSQFPAPKVLIVIAHPDDESGFAATVYKITHDLHGRVDLALVTNGEGGYKYSTLAEAWYGRALTDEAVGRKYLPAIRKKELMNAGKILGIRKFFFLGQKDHRYTTDVEEAFRGIWDTAMVAKRLRAIMRAGKYDFVFTLLPVPETHGHHKGATILALKAAASLPPESRPILLGGSVREKDSTAVSFRGLPGYPLTEIEGEAPVCRFDRTQSFGYKNRLNYKIIANWEIAEHKSQGTMQLYMNRGDYEEFYYYALNRRGGEQKTEALFDSLKILRFPLRNYGE